MRKILIPKKTKGEFREIAVLSTEEKLKFVSYLPGLNEKSKKLCAQNVHGFMGMKSPVTNVKEHIGFQYTLSMDIKDFFDNVTPKMLAGKLSHEETAALMPDGRAYQGLPSSPIVANLAGVDMDKAIIKMLDKKNGVKYTRYADDLSFSFNDWSLYKELISQITLIVSRCGFKINAAKTRLQDARFGKRVITGIAVDSELRATRAVRRRLRAAIHQKNDCQIRGLREWIKLKEPRLKFREKYDQKQLNLLCETWNVQKIKLKSIPSKEEIDLGGVIITGDVPYLLGLSNYATNWTSCMRHPDGLHHKGAPFWVMLSGTRIAILPHETDELEICGFRRKTVRARALIHKMEDGSVYYDRVYGGTEAQITLVEKLEGNNIQSITKASGKVIGRVAVKKFRNKAPYGDSLRFEKINEGGESFWIAKKVK